MILKLHNFEQNLFTSPLFKPRQLKYPATNYIFQNYMHFSFFYVLCIILVYF